MRKLPNEIRLPGELKQMTSRNADCAIDESQKTPDYYTSVRIKTGTDAAFSCLPANRRGTGGALPALLFIKADRKEKEKSDAAEGKERRFRCRPNEKSGVSSLRHGLQGHLSPARSYDGSPRSVTLRPVRTEIPYSLNREYFYLRGKGPVDRIPENAKRGKGESLVFGRAKFEKEPAMLWMKLPVRQGRPDEVAMRADWYFECWLNGKIIYSTRKTGNLEPARFFRFFLPLKKGENLLAVRLFSGARIRTCLEQRSLHRPVRFIPSAEFNR